MFLTSSSYFQFPPSIWFPSSFSSFAKLLAAALCYYFLHVCITYLAAATSQVDKQGREEGRNLVSWPTVQGVIIFAFRLQKNKDFNFKLPDMYEYRTFIYVRDEYRIVKRYQCSQLKMYVLFSFSQVSSLISMGEVSRSFFRSYLREAVFFLLFPCSSCFACRQHKVPCQRSKKKNLEQS